MAKRENQYDPDYVSPPGETIRDLLDERGMNQAELAVRMGRPKKTISEIINGKAAITTETALQLELVLGAPARFWNSREQHYREFLARREQEKSLAAQQDWVHKFPLKALADMGYVPKVREPQELVWNTLRFLGVSSPDQWSEVFSQQQVAFRPATAFEADDFALSAWLRAGEIRAQELRPGRYDRASFIERLNGSKALTGLTMETLVPRLQTVCAEAGVAVVFVPELPKSRVSGATRWLNPDLALIQLSARHKTNDHLWFTFFHEVAHILLHGKRAIYLESGDGEEEDEREADKWAADFLIPRDEYERFALRRPFSREAVVAFADHLGIAPGIVVGRLQHDGLLPFRQLNGLKVRLRWSRDVAWNQPLKPPTRP